jgi:hypothetical protein
MLGENEKLNLDYSTCV